MATPKKTKEAQGILSLVNKPIQFIDCRNERAGHGILRSVDALGWVSIETNSRVLYFHGSKLDAIEEIKESTE